MANARQRIVLGTSVTLVGALMFLVASAYIVDHGFSKWLGLAVGLVAFPLAPGVWHFLGERKRAKKLAAMKKAPSQSLTGGDRLWMRIIVVAIAVIGPMIAASRFGVLKATWRQKGWWWPAASHHSPGEKELLSRVPAESEVVVVVRIPADKQLKREAGTMVAGWSARQGMLAATAAVTDNSVETAAKQFNEDRDKAPWFPLDKVVAVETTGATRVMATEAWKDKVRRGGPGPRAEVLAELARAPSSAQLVAGYVPSSVGAYGITRIATWITFSDKTITAEARVETKDAAAAEALVDRIKHDTDSALSVLPEKCREPAKKLMDATKVTQDGAVVTSRLEQPTEQLAPLMLCGLSFGK